MRCLLIYFFLSCLYINSQNSNITSLNKVADSLEKKAFDKTAIFTLSVFQPTLIQNSNIGKGADANLSFKVGGQLFLYDRFFIGGFFSSTYLDITNVNYTGNYKRSNATSSYLQVGYEAPVLPKAYLAISVAPLGYANYRNFISSERIEQQHDSAKIFIYEAYFSYDISDTLSIFIDYSYRTDRTNVKTAPEIQDEFSKIQYHNFGIGLKFTISSGNFFSNL